MAQQSVGAARLRIAEFEVDPRAGELYRAGRRIRIPPKPFEILLALAERPKEVVSREELRRRLWPDDTIVDFDNNLNSAIATLRDALGDAAAAPRFIETLPKRGYRLLEAPLAANGGSADAASTGSKGAGGARRLAASLAAVAALLVVVALLANRPRGQDAGGEVRLAVLPLSAASGETSELAEGFSDQLIVELRRRLPRDLIVLARSSSFQFPERNLEEAAARLRADYLLHGSLARREGRLRLNAELWRPADGEVLWAERFDRLDGELFAVQDELAAAIGRALERRLTPWSLEPPDPAAYEALLRARYLLGRGVTESVRRAVDELERAVSLDADFAPAWAELSRAWQSLPLPPSETIDRARAAAEQAAERDPELAAAHARLGSIALYYDYDWAVADRALARARELDPGSSEIQQASAGFFAAMGRSREASEAMERARRLDPVSVTVASDAGWYRFVAGDFPGALAACDVALELEPEHRGAHFYRLLTYRRTGDEAAAARAAEADWELLLRDSSGPPGLADSLEGVTPRERLDSFARLHLERRRRLAERQYVSPSLLALDHLELGETERALDLLEASFEQRSGWLMPFLAVYPPLDPLRGEPRFERLLRELGLPSGR